MCNIFCTGVKRGRAGSSESSDSENHPDQTPGSCDQDAELRAQLVVVENERQDIIRGESMSYNERCAIFESVKADAIAQAELQRQSQLRNIEALFEYQQHVATAACEVSRDVFLLRYMCM